MPYKTPMRIPLASNIKQLRVDNFVKQTYMGPATCWRIWLTANGDFTLGTFIQLNYDGTVQRITWHEDGTESIFDIINK